uniref:Uncharacterized protein n=1 Tax=Medicago truncatula TaxID=3880 RepID=A2Q3Z9_MEDTR|nr:hypothetical protein MtrDRAFT_AC155891g19v1 [Medicago truncatula]
MEDVREYYISNKSIDPSTILIPKQTPKTGDTEIAKATAINIQNHAITTLIVPIYHSHEWNWMLLEETLSQKISIVVRTCLNRKGGVQPHFPYTSYS